jgi:hypothetical protein
MSEFKQMRVTGFFKPHDGGPTSTFDIDPASLKITQKMDYLDRDTGGLVASQRTEMTIEDGKTVVHGIMPDGTRVRWTDAEDRWTDRYVSAAHSVIPDGKAVADADERRIESAAKDDLIEHGIESEPEALGMSCGIGIVEPPDWDRED